MATRSSLSRTARGMNSRSVASIVGCMNSIGCKSSQLGSVHKGAVFIIQQTTTRVSSHPLLILKVGRGKSCGFRGWVYPYNIIMGKRGAKNEGQEDHNKTLVVKERALTAAEFHRLAEVPPAIDL